MPGQPKTRGKQAQAAMKALTLEGNSLAINRAEVIQDRRVKYSPELAQRTVELVESGIPIVDSTVAGRVISEGIASRLGISPATIHRWQNEQPGFRESIAHARTESAHRIADQLLSLAQVALARPELAHAVRTAADVLRWSALVRNPQLYGERQRIELQTGPDLGELLREARQRVIESSATRIADVGPIPELPN